MICLCNFFLQPPNNCRCEEKHGKMWLEGEGPGSDHSHRMKLKGHKFLLAPHAVDAEKMEETRSQITWG